MWDVSQAKLQWTNRPDWRDWAHMPQTSRIRRTELMKKIRAQMMSNLDMS